LGGELPTECPVLGLNKASLLNSPLWCRTLTCDRRAGRQADTTTANTRFSQHCAGNKNKVKRKKKGRLRKKPNQTILVVAAPHGFACVVMSMA